MIKNFMPNPMECSEWFPGHCEWVVFTKNMFFDCFFYEFLDKYLHFYQCFFVKKTTYFWTTVHQSEYAIRSDLKFPLIWDTWTAIWFNSYSQVKKIWKLPIFELNGFPRSQIKVNLSRINWRAQIDTQSPKNTSFVMKFTCVKQAVKLEK